MQIAITLPESVQSLGNLFSQHGARLYAVGGLVRNALLGFPPSDYDVCGALPPKDVLALAERSDIRCVPKAIEFGTVELHIPSQNGSTIFEYTTFRSDRYASGHRPDSVAFSSSIEEDAFRRDFSVNALYADAVSGQVTDPTGGLADLEAKILRVTNPNPDEIMCDDGLRVLRLVRFACELGFSIDSASYDSARRHADGLSSIACERIWQETRKILLSDARYGAPQPDGLAAHYRGLLLLLDLGALRYVFDELLEGAGVTQRADYHAYDVLHHCLHVCECTPPVLETRLAGLLHDVAKPRVQSETGRMLGHDKKGAELAAQMLGRLRVEKSVVERAQLLIAHHMLDLDGRAGESTLRRHFVSLGREASAQLADLREADVIGSGRTGKPVATAEKFRALLNRMDLEHVPFSLGELQIRGDEVMAVLNLAPSPKIGRILHRLWLHCAARPRDNNNIRLRRLCKTYENA